MRRRTKEFANPSYSDLLSKAGKTIRLRVNGEIIEFKVRALGQGFKSPFYLHGSVAGREVVLLGFAAHPNVTVTFEYE